MGFLRPWSACSGLLAVVLATGDARAEAACAREDAGLASLAEHLSTLSLRGEALPSPESAADQLRGEGAVFPSLRWIVLTATAATSVSSFRHRAEARAKSAARDVRAPRRACGLAFAENERGDKVAVAVVAPEHALLDPIPPLSRLGTWVTVRARFLAFTPSARLVVLGPRGLPRNVPSSLVGNELIARFSADHEGVFSAQIVGETGDGPLPLAELTTRVGAATDLPASVPGESVLADAPDATVSAMLQAARLTEGQRALERHPALDRLARIHAEALAHRGHLAHDAGDGDPADRVTAAGLRAGEVGENVAHAGTIEECHRALWRSPSHRANLLSGRFRELGVGVVRAKDGSVFVVQLFRD